MAATHLGVQQAPAGFAARSGCITPAIIAALNDDGTTDTAYVGYALAISLTGRLTGPRIMPFVNGLATFYRLAAVTPGAQTLSFSTTTNSSVSLTGTTTSITVAGQTGQFDRDAELPRVEYNPAMPTSFAADVRVTSAATLQSQLNLFASEVDAFDRRIVVADGTAIGTQVVWPARTDGSTGQIVVQSETLPCQSGTRVAGSMFTTQAVWTAPDINQLIIIGAAKANNYRLVGLNITQVGGLTDCYGLVWLGSNADGSQPASAPDIASNLCVDRCWIHGSTTSVLRTGIAFNSGATCVVDSCIEEVHDLQTAHTETHGINGSSGPGPLTVLHSKIEAAGCTFLIGGDDPHIAGLIPSDITFRGNLITTPAAWKGIFERKNIIDLKNCQRVLFEHNIGENCWIDGQDGTGFVPKSSNQEGTAPWSGSSDVTFRYNLMRNVGGAVTFAGKPEAFPAVPLSRLSSHHNGWLNINSATYNGTGRMLSEQVPPCDISFDHETFASSSSSTIALAMQNQGDGQVALNLSVTNSIFTAPTNFGVGADSTAEGSPSFAVAAPDAVFTGNVNGGREFTDAFYQSRYPAGNHFLQAADVGFVDWTGAQASWETGDPDASLAALALAPGGAYSGAGTDGLDPGADMTALRAALAGVFDGSGTPANALFPPGAALLLSLA